MLVEKYYTPLANMHSAVPSANAVESYIDIASVYVTYTATVWLRGFLEIETTSRYEFSVVTNGEVVLYLSTDETAAKKVKLKPFYNSTTKQLG